MQTQATLSIPNPSGGDRVTSSSFDELSPEIQQGMFRRLGAAALLYSGTWVANHLYYMFAPDALGHTERILFWDVITALCVALGLLVYVSCRTRRIPARSFYNVAILFEIAAAIGIMVASFGWELRGEEILRRVATAFGLDGADLTQSVVAPLDREGVRILYHEGVSWVSVWLLVFPLVVPFSMTRTVVATLLTAATVPAMLLASNVLNGIPDATRPWSGPYLLEMTVPTFICAGIAIVGSRVVYRLTRDLSRAQRTGSYHLEAKIGEGGMGEVWKAKHRLLARPAAIKFIHPEALGGRRSTAETALKRFEREAQAISELSSPHSIDLYDFGVTEDGTFYYVMELLRGIDLRGLVERYGPVPAERAIYILRQACHSLHDAHLTGVVHRDVKPGNIFVCRVGPDYDFVKVLDFGLVKHVGEPGAKAADQLTVEGTTSGTPAFMAPEMVYDSRTVDGRADIYALGCVAYWLLTGQLVFVGESPMATLLKQVNDAPPPPSTRTELPIPADLERVILACLEKDPARRPQTAPALSQLLAQCEASLTPWTPDRMLRWWDRHLPEFTRTASPAATPAATPAAATHA